MLGSVLLAALLLGWLIGLLYPFFPERGERLLLLVLPAFLLLVAAGADRLWARSRPAGLVAAWLLIGLAVASLVSFYTVPRYAADDYRPLIAHAVEQGLPEDTVFCVYPWQVGYWRAYSPGVGPTAVLAPDDDWGQAVAASLDVALAQGRVWFPAHLALGAILETRAEAYLRGRATPFVNEWHGAGTRLSAWAVTPPTQPLVFSPIRFSLPGASTNYMELIGVSTPRAPAPAANAVLPISLRWRMPTATTGLDVSLRLTDALGQIWAQHDYELDAFSQIAGERRDQIGLLIPAGTPPGAYAVEVALRWRGDREGGVLTATRPDGTPIGPAGRLFDVAVIPANRPVGPERLPVATRWRQPAELEDGLHFWGYTADNAPAAWGELRKISLFWQAAAMPKSDYVAFVQLLDATGQMAAGWEAPPGAGYATSLWTPGTLIRTQSAFRIPATLPAGRYRLIAGLFRAADGARVRVISEGARTT